MRTVSRRSLLRRSVALTATGALMKPYMVNATATTATVWWTQGFAQEEDIAFKKIVADYEKASGNTIDYNIMPYGVAPGASPAYYEDAIRGQLVAAGASLEAAAAEVKWLNDCFAGYVAPKNRQRSPTE
jgi:ABC-type glycerol-3-phosphate transport system substrate-binding protein